MEQSKEAVEESTAIENASILSELDLLVIIMQHGAKMLKIDHKSRGAMKVFTLDEDLLGFRYQPTSKINRIEIKCIKNVSFTPSVNNNNMGQRNPPMENCFTVEVEKREPLVVVATERRIAQCWVRGLSLLARGKAATDGSLPPKTKWLYDKFNYYDKNNSGIMEFGELIKIIASFNIPFTKDNLMKKFQEFNTKSDQNGQKPGLTKVEFAAFFKSLSQRTDIEEAVMKKYSANGTYLTAQELLEFLKTSQGMTNATEADSEHIVKSYELINEWKSQNCLSVDGFAAYLLSKEGNLFNPLHDTCYQDLNQPLSQYFISSSHNTYLEGDQINGKASMEAYINALKMGCRCVEMDCWDGDDGEPVIYHGHTLVNKIYFKDVVQAVNENAFVASPYPLILSLENHCSVPAQTKMAHYLKDILGDKLYNCSVDSTLKDLPSPEFFKNKILVKGKKLKSTGGENGEGEAGEISEEEDDEVVQIDAEGNVVTAVPEPDQKAKKASKADRKLMKLAPELSKLVNYCTAVHFANFEKSIKEGKCFEMSSFGENKTKKFVKEKRARFIEYNKKQLSRIYPAGSRIHSSNYNPQMAWSAGCQIVALNFQTAGVMMDLYLGKFRQNGNSGYILKPLRMRNEGTKTNNNPQTFSVTIISGHHFPKVSGNSKGEIVDPYVMVAVHDIPDEKQVFQTKVVNNNGFNPCWNETFKFTVKNPELALVRFSVYDHDVGLDDFIAQFSLPFTSIKQGFRQVLLNGHGTKSLFPASLFVHVNIN